MIQLISPRKVTVKTSPGKGLGCFATQRIAKDEIFEECYLLTIEQVPEVDLFRDYRFDFPQGDEPTMEQVLPMGFGCIYNHSDTPNAGWRNHPDWKQMEVKIFQFYATRDIYPGEEICTYYGGEIYWSRRNHIKVI